MSTSTSNDNSTAKARSEAVSAWFLGPQGENESSLKRILELALQGHVKGRKDYKPKDPSSIPAEVKATKAFKKEITKQATLAKELVKQLAKDSVPFWNPRYNAHMNMDTSMPGIIGYFTAMLSNPNNVAIEASPLTTAIEQHVGQELAALVGYANDPPNNPIGWGHITADGSIANLESMWAARNLKFYPLSLRLSMMKELSFIADKFEVPTCTGETKLLRDFGTWELLNIAPSNVLDIPTRLANEFGITPQALQTALQPYLAQTVGKDHLEREFGVKPMSYFASATMHYSWPKGAAITGIGSENVISVKVDIAARMDTQDLRKQLRKCLDEKRAVYAVVAIIGSTEHGACDSIKDIVDVREEFEKEGLSFVLHADGAWGTYFATAIPKDVAKTSIRLSREEDFSSHKAYNKAMHDVFVPTVPLKPKTIESITHLRFCDSITVDPHKSGYIQYPAGGLLYRDQRMRYLVTWTSPIVYRNDVESIGVYGVEGSKPGAAAVAAYFSHSIIGLNPNGYGQLLGEAIFSAVKMYASLATMSTDEDDFVVRPLNLLPAEVNGTPEDIEKQKELIRTKVLPVSNSDLVKDKETWKLVIELGSDLSINAFAANFKINGVTNEDIVEANYINKIIFEALSITKVAETKPDLILTSTVLSQKNYGECLTRFKHRLGLKGDQDLYTLVNVVMSPWPTATGMTKVIIESLKKTIEAKCAVSLYRNTLTDDFHAFVMQGDGENEIFFVHLAMFNMENHRMQLIITGTVDDDMKAAYVKARKDNPNQVYLLVNQDATTLHQILEDKEFSARIEPFVPNAVPLVTGQFSDVRVIAHQKLNSTFLKPYPMRRMPFFIYGSRNQTHIDHVYTASPNIQMSADQVTVTIDGKVQTFPQFPPYLYAQINLPESLMQPFAPNSQRDASFFFHSGAEFHDIEITEDLEGKLVVYHNVSIKLGTNIVVDTDMLNADPLPEPIQSVQSSEIQVQAKQPAVMSMKILHSDHAESSLPAHSVAHRGQKYTKILADLNGMVAQSSEDGYESLFELA